MQHSMNNQHHQMHSSPNVLPNQQQPAYGNFLYENSVIQMPKDPADTKHFDPNHRYYRFVIDSRDRDTNSYPNVADYVVNLPDQINDVISITLVNADMNLFAKYMVNDNNRFFSVSTTANSTSNNVNIAAGDYDIATISAGSIVTAMDGVVGLSGSSIDASTETFTVTVAASNFLRFNSNNKTEDTLARLLGFLPDTDYGPGLVTSPYRVNLVKDKYAVMNIDQVELLHGLNKPIWSSFAIIPDRQSSLAFRGSDVIKKDFNPPLNSLQRLKISIYDYYGKLFDFQNQNHKIEFIFKTKNQR
jgi:hypothetical protein